MAFLILTQASGASAPGLPGTPSFSSITTTSATVTWTAASGSVTGYKYNINSGAYIDVGNVLTVNLTGLTASTNYTVGVLAYNTLTGLPSSNNFTTSSSGSFDYYISTTGSDSNPGTSGSPWAITAINTKQGTYAGKRVGLQDGTYNVSGFSVVSGASVLLEVVSGSSGAPTVIQAVNPRQAIITGNNSGTLTSYCILGSGLNGENSRASIQYVTIDGLEINGSAHDLIGFDSSGSAGSQAGIVIQNCLLHNMVNPSGASNCGGVNLGTSIGGALIHNCHIYDCYEAGISRNAHGNASAIYDWAINTTIEYCTIHDCSSAVYQKNQSAGPPQGETFRYNYVYYGASGMNCILDGFNNASGNSPPYNAQAFYGNVFEIPGQQGHYNSNSGNLGFQASISFYNNTIYTNGSTYGWQDMLHPTAAVTAGCRLSAYNNVYVRPSGQLNTGRGLWTDFAVNLSAISVMDYNLWPTDVALGTGTDDGSYPTSHTLAQFQALSGTPDAHSISGVPTFVNGSITLGAGTTQYQLTSGSTGHLAGHVGGVSGGSAVDMGAWGSGASQIGSSF